MISRLTIIFLIGSSAFFTKAIAQGVDSVQLLYQQAQLHVQKGDYQSALADLQLIHTSELELQLKVDSFKILLLHQLSRIDEAKQACYDYLRLAPDDVNVHITLGEILMSVNEPYEALGEFSWVAENRPDLPLGFIMRAMVTLQLGEIDAAKRDLETVEAGNVDNFTSTELVQMSTIFNMIGEHEKGLKYAEKSLGKDPHPQAYAVKGWALWGLKYYRESLTPLTQSIEAQPTFLAYVLRGKAYYMLKDYTKAEVDFKTSLSMQPQLEEAYVFLGYIYQSRNNLKDACECWRKAERISKETDVSDLLQTWCK